MDDQSRILYANNYFQSGIIFYSIQKYLYLNKVLYRTLHFWFQVIQDKVFDHERLIEYYCKCKLFVSFHNLKLACLNLFKIVLGTPIEKIIFFFY